MKLRDRINIPMITTFIDGMMWGYAFMVVYSIWEQERRYAKLRSVLAQRYSATGTLDSGSD